MIVCQHATLLHAQGEDRVGGRSEVFAGGELETYLRDLQLIGAVPLYPWSVRSFSPSELDRLFPVDSIPHPWRLRYDLHPAPHDRLTFDVVRPTASTRFNSTFPYGSNDGPIWAGRGLTAAVQIGVTARYHSLSVTIAPLAFAAQNASFSLLANGDTGKLAFGDGVYAGGIDRPQRFGARPYTVLDPGQSTVRLDAGALTLGVSTANQYWGPAAVYPAVLGNNAAGFPHAFLGTAHPVDLWLVRVHGRLVWGRLNQSSFSSETAGGGIRFMAGLVGVLTPRGLPGLEFGLSRFIHTPWPQSGLSTSELLLPLVSRNRENQLGTANDNQLAAAFARWVFPRSGVEFYGEYGREDYNADLRDFIDEPDHIGGYMASLGLRKAFGPSDGRLIVLGAEVVNEQRNRTASEIGRPPPYTHGTLGQGHTERGQILGADIGIDGTGATLSLDSYHTGGRWSVRWTRILRGDRGNFPAAGQVDPRARDVQHALTFERLFFRGRYDILAGLTAVYEFNRNSQSDAFNLNAIVVVRADVPGYLRSLRRQTREVEADR